MATKTSKIRLQNSTLRVVTSIIVIHNQRRVLQYQICNEHNVENRTNQHKAGANKNTTGSYDAPLYICTLHMWRGDFVLPVPFRGGFCPGGLCPGIMSKGDFVRFPCKTNLQRFAWLQVSNVDEVACGVHAVIQTVESPQVWIRVAVAYTQRSMRVVSIYLRITRKPCYRRENRDMLL